METIRGALTASRMYLTYPAARRANRLGDDRPCVTAAIPIVLTEGRRASGKAVA